MKSVFFILFSFIFITTLHAQTVPGAKGKITGKVTDDKGETLVGVNVSEKGTRNQAVTDINGNYRISVAGPASVLVFTYVGHNSVEVAVGNRSTVNVTMVPQATEIGRAHV